jgi:tripartite-type tricarboxylate transporter receptor subunit TctC
MAAGTAGLRIRRAAAVKSRLAFRRETPTMRQNPIRCRLVPALLAAAALLGAMLGAPAARAAFPDRPVTVVVPYPPGGAADVLGRIVARHLQLQLPGSTFVVENKAGGGTSVGAQAVAQAAPDGYTLLTSSNTTWTMNPALKARLPYDTLKSFESIGTIGSIPLMLVAHPGAPFSSVKELVAQARAQPGKLNYASFGPGTSSHFAGEMFKAAAEVEIVHVPYKGSAPAMQDLIGGQVPLSFDTNIAALPQIKAGKIKALAVTTARRIAGAPEVPTLAESGLPGFELSAWVSFVAPKGLPADVRATLVRALAEAMKTPALRDELGKAGLDVGYEPPAAFEERVNRELPAMRALVRKAGITVD